jgi:DNA-binding cell septation regulator SpoVG
MTNNAQSTQWLRDLTNEATEAAKKVNQTGDVTINITYAPVTNNDNRQVHIHNGRSHNPHRATAICHPNRHQLTGSYADRIHAMTRAEREALWDAQARGQHTLDNFIY